MITNLYTDKAHLSDSTVTSIYKSFTHKMAAKTSWHRYGTKLRHCHPMYNKTVKMMHQFCISLDTPVHNLTFLQDSVYQELFKSVDI